MKTENDLLAISIVDTAEDLTALLAQAAKAGLITQIDLTTRAVRSIRPSDCYEHVVVEAKVGLMLAKTEDAA